MYKKAYALNYRADIDGLRAIAVLSVIAYHAFPLWIVGGFVGVDIFFVISGYLIGGILIDDITNNKFSFLKFYNRRIKRIFPSLILVFGFCLLAGYFFLLAEEYELLGKNIAAGSIFISNIILLKDSGYFDDTSDTNPLLHLWSLSIEEQFYIFFPILLIISFKFRANIFLIILLVLGSSFLLNLTKIQIIPVEVFYSPLTRVWELVAGSLLAYLLIKFNEISKFKPLTRNLISITGLCLILFSVLKITANDLFPGFWALIPVIGAFFLIFSGQTSWVNKFILSNPIMVWFGLISYPLYLWHWPILTFIRILNGGEPTNLIRILIVFISVVLAWLTYIFIEKPIRFGKSSTTKPLILIFLMFIIGSMGYFIYLNDGLKMRNGGLLNQSSHADEFKWSHYKSKDCDKLIGIDSNFCLIIGNPSNIKIAIIGDSTGNSLTPGLGELLQQRNEGVINIGSWTCPPIHGIDAAPMWGKKNNCVETINKGYEYILQNPSIKVVVLAIFARDLKLWQIMDKMPIDERAKFEIVKSGIESEIQSLKKAGKEVIVTYDAPFFPYSSKFCIQRPFSLGSKNCVFNENDLRDRFPYVKYFDENLKSKDICVFRQTRALVVNGKFSFQNERGQFLVRDTHHLTSIGSLAAANELLKQCPI